MKKIIYHSATNQFFVKRSLGMVMIFLCSVGVFAQSKFKNKQAGEFNSSGLGGYPNIQLPNKANNAVPLAAPSLWDGALNNFTPMEITERPTVENPLQIMRDADGDIVMIKGSLDKNTNNARNAVQRVQDYLSAMSEVLDLRDVAKEFRIQNIETDELGIEHIRLQQVLNGVAIYGAEIILHGKNNHLEMMNGRFYPTPDIQNLNASLNERAALDNIEKDLQKQGFSTEGLHKKLKFAGENKVELVIYHKDRDAKAERLSWHYTVFPNRLQRFEYFIDAQNGAVLHEFNHTCNFVGEICHNHEVAEELPPLDGPYTVDAVDLLGISRTLNTHAVSNTYYMLDTKRTMFNAAKSKMPDDPVGAIWTLDAFNTSPEVEATFKYNHVKSTNNIWSNKTAVSAHYNAGIAYDYYKKTFNRESIDGAGGTIISLINITEKTGKSMENAFWNGEMMFYGNGGTAFFPLARGLDVAGHEMSHGVIQATAGLEYQGESGAMNESFADIFGAMIDRNDWQIGEDVVQKSVFPTGALRDLSNPNNGGKSLNDAGWQPKSVSEKYTGSQDNGGVHINSGITNFAYYKFASATTKEKGEAVFYRALTKYLVKSSKFIDLRAAVVQSATDLYGATSNEVTQAQNAFASVGIGSGGSATGDNYQTNVNSNPGSDFVVYTNNDYKTINVIDISKNTPFKVSDLEINSRPSVTDDGTEMVFVGVDKKPYLIDFDWAKGTFVKDQQIDNQAIYKNIAISKNGNLLAVTTFNTLGKADNKITIFDFSKSPVTQKTFTLYNPTYTQGVSTGNVQYSDALEFDFTGEYLMYDAFNKVPGATGSIDYWDVGFLKVYDNKAKNFGDGKIEKLFSKLPENTSIGNAQFSKNSPHIIVFDYQDDYDKKNYLVSANLQTGKTGALYTNNDLGFPSFSRKDDKIVFEGGDFIGNYIATLDLNTDKLSAKANTLKILKDNTHWPLWFSNGVRKLNVATDDNILENVNIYPNPVENNLTIEANELLDNQNLQVIDILGKTLMQQRLSLGKNTLSVENISAGTYFLKVGHSTRKIVKM